MSFQLVYGDHEYILPLIFEPHIEDRLIRLIGKAMAGENQSDAGDLSRKIVDSISALIEFNDIPPTDKQLKYAIGIAQTLKMQLPAEVIQYRDAMAQFLKAMQWLGRRFRFARGGTLTRRRERPRMPCTYSVAT